MGQNRFKLVPGQGSDKAASDRNSRSSGFFSLWVVYRSRPAGRPDSEIAARCGFARLMERIDAPVRHG